jgi:hypothetical protein
MQCKRKIQFSIEIVVMIITRLINWGFFYLKNQHGYHHHCIDNWMRDKRGAARVCPVDNIPWEIRTADTVE